MASTATESPPSVPFLNPGKEGKGELPSQGREMGYGPMGKETPEASSRWSWDSVVMEMKLATSSKPYGREGTNQWYERQ